MKASRLMLSLNDFALAKLAELDQALLRRRLVETTREDGLWVTRNKRRLLSFSCNDYLNLSHHPQVKQAACEAIERHGVGASASRLISGNHPLFSELEARLARFKGTQSACVFGSGYLANLGIIPVLTGPADLILIDELSHACLFGGAQLAKARVIVFRHNDLAHAEQILAAERKLVRHALLVTDGVFSMDGDLAPLPALAELCTSFDCWLMSDDAHGLGVLGQGHGSNNAFVQNFDIPLQMGTLSKAIGSYGGYLCASEPVIDLIKTRARTVVYSTGLPPALTAAAIKALEIIETDAALVARPLANARIFTQRLGLPDATSPIVPIILGTAEKALAAGQRLEQEGFLVTPIRPPTVPQGTARLRFAFTAGHTEQSIKQVADLVQSLLPNDT
jgi:8-amino-7-oxononanoate synthase